MSKIRVAWGTPAYRRQVDVQTIDMTIQMIGRFDSEKFSFAGHTFTDSCAIAEARDIMIAQSRENGVDWLLMSDADTYTLDGEHVWSMIATGEELGAVMIGAPCLMRNGRGYNVILENEQRWATHEELAGKVQKAQVIGSGFIAANVNWIVRNWPESPWFCDLRPKGENPMRIGSDRVFCMAARKLGGEIYSYGHLFPVHVGVGATGHEECDKRELERSAA